MAIIKKINFFIYCIVSFLSSIHGQYTALVLTGRALDNKATFGIILGNPIVYLQEFSEGNYSTDSSKSKAFTSSSNTFRSIAYDARTKYIGISEINLRALLIFELPDIWEKSSTISTKYRFDRFPISSNISGIAFASNFNLIYWVDAIFQYVGVVDFKTSQWTKIANVTFGTPNSIAVHERQRFVFWSVIAVKPKIERSNLFGEERTTIVDVHLTQPISLVIDKQSEKLFWLDGNLKSCDFDGRNIVTYIIPDSGPYSSFAVYKNIFMFTKLGGAITAFKILENNDLRSYTSFYFTNIMVISSTSLDSMEFVANDRNPCINNVCDHLCFPRNKTNYVCNCTFGFSLGPDGKTCNQAILTHGHLLVGDSTGRKIYQVDPNSGKTEFILNLNIQPSNMKHIAYYLNVSFYYILEDNQRVYSSIILPRITFTFYIASSNITDMVVDQKTGNLFVANLNGQIVLVEQCTRNKLQICTVKNGRIIIDDPKLNIHKLFIHSQTRRFFYSDCAQKTVVEIDIETNTKKNIIQAGVCVDSMDFDFDYHWAFYGDNENTVWRHDLNNPTKALVSMFKSQHFIWDLASDKDSLYIVQYSHDIIKLDKKSLSKSILIQHTFRNASEIIYITFIRTPSTKTKTADNLLSRSFGSMYLLTSMLLITTQLWQLLLD